MNRRYGTRLRHRVLRWEELERREVLSATGVEAALPTTPMEVESPTVVTAPENMKPAATTEVAPPPIAMGINDPLVNSPIPGIPPGDAGGVGGGNGPGRLPLQIPGFEGTGNAYVLNLATESLPQIVWFYNYLYGNQRTVAPGTPDLETPKTNLDGMDAFGVRLFPAIFNGTSYLDLEGEDVKEKPTEENEQQIQTPDEREEIEKEIRHEIERFLREEQNRANE